MRYFTIVAVAVLSFGLVASGQDAKNSDKKEKTEETKKVEKTDAVTFVMDFTEKSYGVKFISASRKDYTHAVLVELTKDTLVFDELQKLKLAFATPIDARSQHGMNIIFYYFDSDGVILGKRDIGNIEGEISGTKGDRFRVIIPVSPNSYDSKVGNLVRKIVARQRDPLSKKDNSPKEIKSDKKPG